MNTPVKIIWNTILVQNLIAGIGITVAENYLEKIKENAPIKTGLLLSSIRIVKYGIFGERVFKTLIVSGALYSKFIEFGTSTSAAHPFVRPATAWMINVYMKTINIKRILSGSLGYYSGGTIEAGSVGFEMVTI